jgi:hypothetical protein
MKKPLFILALILISFGAKAMIGDNSISYVKTGSEVYFGQDLKIGFFNYKLLNSDGTVKKIPVREVVAYTHNSQHFDYLPVVNKSNVVTGYAMMEYVTQRNGLNLYRRCCIDEKSTRYDYYIFKNGEFHLKIDQENAKTTLPFFGIKVV